MPSGRSPVSERRPSPILVELVRLAVVVMFTAVGYEVARTFADELDSRTVILGALLGSSVGYVAGGVFGRTVNTMVGAAERRLAEISGADFVAGGFGMLAGLLGGAFLGWPVLFIPERVYSVPILAFLIVVSATLGSRVAIRKREDILQLFGLSYRTRAPDLRVLDSSAILDVRLLDCVRSGFLRGTLLLPQFVLEEIQSVADAGDPARRARGRHGLETLSALKREGVVDVRVVERHYPDIAEVDAKIIALARERGAAVVSNDVPLRRVAELQGIEVLSIAELASALRPPVLPGERVRLELLREGREPGQAVGYLEDGSMVVVERGRELLGRTAEVIVSSLVHTAGGTLLFARLAGPIEAGGHPEAPGDEAARGSA